MSKTLGIENFAKLAKVEAATARVMLRSIGHVKKGRSYEFGSQGEMQKLIDKFRSGKGRVEKPATKKKAKKSKKKVSPKKKKLAKKASSKKAADLPSSDE